MLSNTSILRNHDIKALKKLGQHFLNNPEIVQKIINTFASLKGEMVLEIGPGLGILTEAILQEPIRKLFCVEYDQRCVQYLQTTLLPTDDRLFLIAEDALKLDEEKLVEKAQKLIVIANLPYNISTLLLFKWLKIIHLFKRMTLMFQKEVAERICARPNTKQYGIPSILTQFLCTPKIEFEVPAKNFSPQPKVNSAVVSIIPRRDLKDRFPIEHCDTNHGNSHYTEIYQLYKKLELLCKTVFNKRRKTLKNSISSIIVNPEEKLLSIGINPNRRPENLLVEEFELIARKLVFKMNVK